MFATLSLFFALLFGSAPSAGFITPTSPVTEPKPITIEPDTKGGRGIVRLPPLQQK